jgi:predicted NBD/HSP70 family sugar kinase
MSKAGMNMETVRYQNRALILDYINSKGPVSRTDIAAASGLTAASVTLITTRLLAEGILKETGTTIGTGAGRRRVLLDIDASAAYVLAVNIEPKDTVIAVCDLKGNVPEGPGSEPLLRTVPTDRDSAPEAFLAELCKICKELQGKLSNVQKKRLECVSIGITGLVDVQNAVSVHAYGIWDRPVDLKAAFSSRLGLPVIAENNVDAFATAEQLYGVGRIRSDLLIIKWGPGVGSAIIIDGVIYKGRQGKAAEIGHYIVDPAGKKCNCGRRGCMETYVSFSALNEIMPFAPDEFESAYLAADSQTRARIDTAIDLFARCIVNTGTLIAPSRIILAGNMFKGPAIREKLIKACTVLDGTYNAESIIYTPLSGREAYVGPAAIFAQKKLLEGSLTED